MNTYLECIPCFFRQALFAARAATKDEAKAKEVFDRISELIPNIPLDSSPPETGRLVYRMVREVTGVVDPFNVHKAESIENALSLYKGLKSAVEDSQDPLRSAVRIAIAGNVVDLGANPDFDLEGEMKDVLGRDLSIDHYGSFRRSIEKARGSFPCQTLCGASGGISHGCVSDSPGGFARGEGSAKELTSQLVGKRTWSL